MFPGVIAAPPLNRRRPRRPTNSARREWPRRYVGGRMRCGALRSRARASAS